MKKQFILGVMICCCMLSCMSVSLFAQQKLKPWQHKGYILDAEGNKVEGIVELNAWGTLWMNQATIGFVSNTKLEELQKAGKKKMPIKWFKAKDLKGYGYDDKKFVTKDVKLDIGLRKRMVEIISEEEGTFKFYNSTSQGPTPPQSFVTLRENSQGILE